MSIYYSEPEIVANVDRYFTLVTSGSGQLPEQDSLLITKFVASTIHKVLNGRLEFIDDSKEYTPIEMYLSKKILQRVVKGREVGEDPFSEELEEVASLSGLLHDFDEYTCGNRFGNTEIINISELSIQQLFVNLGFPKDVVDEYLKSELHLKLTETSIERSISIQ